jgi:hypothetical protein
MPNARPHRSLFVGSATPGRRLDGKNPQAVPQADARPSRLAVVLRDAGSTSLETLRCRRIKAARTFGGVPVEVDTRSGRQAPRTRCRRLGQVASTADPGTSEPRGQGGIRLPKVT